MNDHLPAASSGTADSTRLTQFPHPCMADLPCPPALPGYEILEELGRGGMGVVYKARHLGLDRLVALKMILHADYAGQEMRDRFHVEARALARLQHPNIVPIFEVGEHQGQPYFALEFCGGGSLAQKLAGQPQPPREAAVLVEALARAMQSAHDARLVHRDLKPANILLTFSRDAESSERSAGNGKNGTDGANGTNGSYRSHSSHWSHHAVPKITDFGSAKRLDEAGQTQTGDVLGTPSYMAPEQAQGKGKEVGPAADVYALGAILYECLTGRPPFKLATSAETLVKVLTDEPAAPRQSAPGVPRDLETICLKCLEKEPAKRYASASDLADDLNRFLGGRPIQARPTPRWERAWKWSKRRPAAATAVVAAVVLLFAGAAGALWHWDANLRTKVEFYKGSTRRNGAYEGVGKVRAEDVSHRNQTLKFYRRGGRVVKMEIVNGHGQPMPNQGISMIEGVDPADVRQRPCSYELVYNQAGEVVNQIGRNRAGREVLTLHYTSPTTAHFTDEKGYVRGGKGSEAAYVRFVRTADGLEKEIHYLDTRGEPQPSYGVYGSRIQYDEHGLPVEFTSFDADGRPAPNKDGFATSKIRYDQECNVREIAFFGVDGKPALHKDGYAGSTTDYDSYGNMIEVNFFGVDGRPALHKDGYATIKSRYDQWGDMVETRYFGVDGQPALHKDGNAGFRTRYDEKGNPVEMEFLGLDGRPALNKHGYAGLRVQYDDRGNMVETDYFGTDGKPVLSKVCVAGWKMRHDENGNPVEVSYFGLDGRPALHRDGNASRRIRYDDDRGNKVEEAYFGVDGQPTLVGGVHKVRFHYDRLGNLDELSYFGINDRPALHNNGYALVKFRHDERGNKTEEIYFDRDGKPMRIGGVARIAMRYDDRGKKVEQSYLGLDNKPTAHRDGNVRVRWKYDERGNQTEVAFLDAEDNLVNIKAGYARIVRAYDERGNKTEEAYFGPDDRPVLRNGVAKMLMKYDPRGNNIEQIYLGFDDKPVMHSDGNARVRWKYDERGNQTEEAYFDRDGKPMAIKAGHARIVWCYDERGNNTEEAYFGIDGEPVLHDGAAKVVMQYDDRGRVVEKTYLRYPAFAASTGEDEFLRKRVKFDPQGRVTEVAYFDLEGRPMPHAAGYHAFTNKYDDRGNIVETVYLDVGGKPVRHRRRGYAKIRRTWNPRGEQTGVAYFDEADQPVRTQVVIGRIFPGGQAVVAGLKDNDVVREYDNQPIRFTHEFVAAIEHRAGSGKPGPVSLRVRRGGKDVSVSVQPGKMGVALEDRAADR